MGFLCGRKDGRTEGEGMSNNEYGCDRCVRITGEYHGVSIRQVTIEVVGVRSRIM